LWAVGSAAFHVDPRANRVDDSSRVGGVGAYDGGGDYM